MSLQETSLWMTHMNHTSFIDIDISLSFISYLNTKSKYCINTPGKMIFFCLTVRINNLKCTQDVLSV